MQRIATVVRLNRSVLQLDDSAHARLERYLEESASLLEGDPDPQEILADLEQAVAEQCTRRLPPDQAVVTLSELEPALEEIGSVQLPGNGSASSSQWQASPPSSRRPAESRSLQQVSQGALISGVCLGLAEYFKLDAVVEYATRLRSAVAAARVGWFLEQHRQVLMVDDACLARLEHLRPRQPRYFDGRRESGKFLSRWNLVVPPRILDRAWEEPA